MGAVGAVHPNRTFYLRHPSFWQMQVVSGLHRDRFCILLPWTCFSIQGIYRARESVYGRRRARRVHTSRKPKGIPSQFQAAC